MADRKTIFITGGNRGIGRGLVEALSGEHNVLFSLRKDSPQKGNDTLQKADTLPAVGTPLFFDVTDGAGIQKALQRIDTKIDILINNAGIFLDYSSPALEVDMEDILRTFDVNTLGPLRVCRAIVPLMRDGGRIINISSGMGQLSEMGGGAIAYRISKTALNALTRILSNELRDKNISVNSICPGWVKTDMGGSNASRSIEESVAKIVQFALRDRFPTGKFLRDGQEIPW